jgi:hypothetical protein
MSLYNLTADTDDLGSQVALPHPSPSPAATVPVSTLDKDLVAWKSEFSMRDTGGQRDVTVALTTNFTSKDEPGVDWKDVALKCNAILPGACQFPPSVLKSILQKNVRMCRPWPAVRAALQLIKHEYV